MHVRLSMTVYDEQRELEIRSISSLLMLTSRERRQGKQDTCKHVRLSMTVYDIGGVKHEKNIKLHMGL